MAGKSSNFIAPIEICLKLMEPENVASLSTVSKDENADSSGESIVFNMTFVKGYLLMEDIIVISSCIKDCKECFSPSDVSHTTRKMETNAVVSVSSCEKQQLSYNLCMHVDDICLSLISHERGSSFSVGEIVISNFYGNGIFWPLSREYSIHSSLLLRLYQFAVVHG